MLLFLFVIIFRGSSVPSDMTGLTLYRGHVGTFMIKRHELQICHHFIFVFSLYFFYHSCCRIKAGSVSTVKSFNFKVWYWRLYWSRSTKDPVDSHHWFVVEVLPSQVFRNLNPERARNSHIRPLSYGFTDWSIFRCSLELFWAKWKLSSIKREWGSFSLGSICCRRLVFREWRRSP